MVRRYRYERYINKKCLYDFIVEFYLKWNLMKKIAHNVVFTHLRNNVYEYVSRTIIIFYGCKILAL